jgi:hypothetical protein
MSATPVQQTGIQGATAFNGAIGATDEVQYHTLIPVVLRPSGYPQPMQLVNVGANSIVVQRAVTTAAGTSGVTVPAGGSLLIEGTADTFVYSTAGSSIAFVEA